MVRPCVAREFVDLAEVHGIARFIDAPLLVCQSQGLASESIIQHLTFKAGLSGRAPLNRLYVKSPVTGAQCRRLRSFVAGDT
jgi:hypothetical protein